MATIYISNSIKNAANLPEVVSIINGAADGHVEGMEGVEFTPEQLAGQYAHAAAAGSGFVDEYDIWGQLDIVETAGANFNYYVAVDHGMAIAAAKADDAE